jgi:hypothetical protein
MVRMASKESFTSLLKKGYPVDQCQYNKYDCLESNDDLEQLIEVLMSVRDTHGNPAVMTINNIVGNPDFKAIRESNYESYVAEPFTDTLSKYSNRDQVMEFYKSGISNNCLSIQYHGREHVHINNWLSALRLGEIDIIDAFEHGMYSIHRENKKNCTDVFLDAWSLHTDSDRIQLASSMQQGMEWFKTIWGYYPITAIAPCYTWNKYAEKLMIEYGVRGIQSARVQKEPQKDGKMKHIRHYMGQTNDLGQIYTIRNALYEPTIMPNIDSISTCLKQVQNAFFHKKPAIISTHRINYAGTLSSKNRDYNLSELKILLKELQKNWPTIEFMCSRSLCDIIRNQTP